MQPGFAGGQDLAVKQLDEVGLGGLVVSELGHYRETKSDVHQLVLAQQSQHLLLVRLVLHIAWHLLESPQVDIVDEELREIEVQLSFRFSLWCYNCLQPLFGIQILGGDPEQGVLPQLDFALQDLRVVLVLWRQFVGYRVTDLVKGGR